MAEHGQKRNLNISTIGHVDHGKTTMTAALGSYFAIKKGEKLDIGDIDNHKEEKARGITINTRSILYETKLSRVSHTDCPGHADFMKNMITGSSQSDGCLLVVSAPDGPQTQTVEHIKTASASNIKTVIVLLNKIDLIPQEEMELLDLSKEEILSLLTKHGYKEEEVKFISVSAVKALEEAQGKAAASEFGIMALEKIGEALDLVPLKSNEEKNKMPFSMTVGDMYSIPGRGTVAAGTVSSGVLEKKKEAIPLEIIKKNNERIKIEVTDMQIFHTSVDRISTGSNAALLIRGLERTEISRGDIIVAPGEFPSFYFAKVQFYLFETSDGGRKTGVGLKYTPHIFVGARDTPAQILQIEGQDIIEPGQSVPCWFVFLRSMIQDPDHKSLIIRESNQIVGLGVFLETTNVPPVTITAAMVKQSAIVEMAVKGLKLKVAA